MRMKRTSLVLCVLLVFLLCACGKTSTTYTVIKNNVNYLVDTEQKTISDGEHVYHYNFSGNASSYKMDVTYPDGSTYWFSKSGYSGQGGWSDGYDEKKYVDGDTLCEVLLEKAPREANSGNIFAAVFVAAIGVFNIVSPYTAWYLEYGWRYKNAEPSDIALGLNRVVGVIAVIIAVVILFI